MGVPAHRRSAHGQRCTARAARVIAWAVMPDEPVDAGQRVARFTLRARLGEGGMGQVWRARDPELERDVAVKLLRPEVVTSAARADEARGRMRREAQAMARLAHPNVISIYEVGEADARVFLVMELVDGGTLTQWLAARTAARHR